MVKAPISGQGAPISAQQDANMPSNNDKMYIRFCPNMGSGHATLIHLNYVTYVD